MMMMMMMVVVVVVEGRVGVDVSSSVSKSEFECLQQPGMFFFFFDISLSMYALYESS